MRSRALNLAALALLAGLCGSTDGVVRQAAAQQLDANKPPAQIFAGTCAACHKSPRGLVKSVAPGSLPSFLRQHYTTGNDMAGTMANFVLGNGGTQQVAEPSPRQEPKQQHEPKQRAKSEGTDVAVHTPAADPKAQAKAAKQQKAGKKGQVEPPVAAVAPTVREPEPAKPETPAAEPAKSEAAVDCKVEPAKQAEEKPGFPPSQEATPPRQPAALLTLPGFPAPAPEPEPEPAATPPGCEPGAAPVTTAAHADVRPAETTKEQAPATPPPALAEAPKTESLRATVSEPPLRATVTEPPVRATATEPPPALDIMREEVHAPRLVRTGQKRRATPPPQ